jgi:phage-related protein
MRSVETLDKRVDRELAKLPRDLFARFLWIADILTEQGPEAVRMPHVRSLSGAGSLWEIRMSGKDGIARAIYVKASGQRLVVVYVFQKKTQKTPKTALETARKRAKEVT